MLPIAMLTGVLFHESIGHLAFLSRYLIFVMLLITYCRLDISDFKVGKYIWLLLAAQVGGAAAVYLLLRPVDEIVAQGAFICVFCPTATAAPVITGMLGGSVGRVAVYSLFSHGAVALLAPVLLAFIGEADVPGGTIAFGDSLLAIARSVMPLIIGPLAVAALMGRFAPQVKKRVAGHQGLSFYIWAVALVIVVGNSVSFLMREPASAIPLMLILAGAAFIMCAAQFWTGRRIGERYADKVSGAQSLGQKNTVLAIWLTLNYLDPLASAAPAAYVAWHNIINSYQIYRRSRTQANH